MGDDLKKVKDVAGKGHKSIDDYDWLDDYLDSKKTASKAGVGSGSALADSEKPGYWFGSKGRKASEKPKTSYDRNKDNIYGGGYGYGDWYGGGNSWDDDKPSYGSDRKTSWYSGGSGSVFSSRSSYYGGRYTAATGGTGIENLKKLLDIKSFVSNLIGIHDPVNKKAVTFNVETNCGIGNILDESSKTIPMLPEIITDSKKHDFNARLDILSGQALLTSTLHGSDVKDKIKKVVKKQIKDFIAKQPSAQDEIKILLRMIVSMFSESLAERDVIDKSPGYKNYVNSFKDYYYGERFKDGIEKHGILSPVDVLYVKIRRPDKMDEIKEAAEKKLESADYKRVVKACDIIDSVLAKTTINKPEDLFNASVRALMGLLSVSLKKGEAIEDVTKGIVDIGTASLGTALGRAGVGSSLDMSLRDRKLDANEVEIMSALKRLEDYNYANYKMKDPVDDGTTHFSEYSVDYYTEKGDKHRYETVRSGMDQYVGALKRMMRFRDFVKTTTLTSQRRGKLDKGKLAVANSTDRIYKKVFLDSAQDVSICLLVDESGSMSGAGIAAARSLACLFAEAFLDSKSVDLHIYGHTAQEGESDFDGHVILRKYPTKTSISAIKARVQNIDGIAIHSAATDFLKVAKGEHKIMIVLSDGNPSAYGYSGSRAVNHTKKCVDLVEKMGIQPMQVAIASHVNSDRMFKRWFKFTDMSTFIPSMEKMIKKVLKDVGK